MSVSSQFSLQGKRRTSLRQLVKTIIATVSAWFVALLIFPHERPIFAAIAAIIIIQPSVNQSLGKAFERSTGVFIGVGLASVATIIFGPQPWLVLVAMVMAFVSGWVLKFTSTTASQIAISSMLVLALGAVTPERALSRIAETLIGACIALIVNMAVSPPIPVKPAREAIGQLGLHIATIFEDIGSGLRRSTSDVVLEDIYARARSLRFEYSEVEAKLARAQEALRFNLLKGKHQPELDAQAKTLLQLSILSTRVVGVARGVRDHYDQSVIEEPGISDISMEFIRAGHDLRLRMRDAGLADDGVLAGHDVEPALTTPIELPRPSSKNWVLVGFLMENLRRIRDEVAGTPSD
jgi:uncharacterized membrane protein YccC